MFIADEANDRVRKVNTSGTISTVAGNGLPYLGYGGDGGPAVLSVLGRATGSGTLSVSGFYTLRGWVPGVAADRRGNVFIADANNQRVRKVDAAGIITTFAGNGIAGYAGDGGPATAAQLQQPVGMSFDGIGNMYVAEYGTHHVRKIDTLGIITTVAGGGSGGLGDGGPATAAVISAAGLCVDSIGNIFIVDIDSQRIRKVNASTGIISTVAGNGFAGFSGDGGAATLAQLNYPVGVAVDKRGNLYISDHVNARIRKVDTAGIISTIAGSGMYADYLETNLGDYGPATSATIAYPMGITTDRYGNVIFADHGIGPTNASDSFRSRYTRVREIDQHGYIHTVAGNGIQGYAGDGGSATAAEFQNPWGVAMDTAGALYIADNSNYAVRKACCLPNPTDHPPSFTGGTLQTLSLCAGSSTTAINTIMTISDLDLGDTETWSVARAPTHGILGGFPSSVTATGGTIVPSGFSYTPATGYSGNDTFIIKISDGYYYTPTTVIVSINPFPVAGSISGPSSVCVGATITLSGSAGAGLWSFSNSHATIGSATGIVTGVTSGVDTARYTVTNSCGTAVTTHIITVNAVPTVAAISGPSSLCVSSSITLASATAGGTWSSSYPYIALGSVSGVVTGIAPGIAIINYAVTNSCGSGTASATVTVNPAAYAGTITGSTSICIGGTTTLGNAIPGGVWSSGAAGIATIGSSTGIVTGIAAGSVVISYTLSSVGCGPAVAITIINVSTATPILPITGPSGVCAGSSISLSNATPGGVWSSSNPSIATVSTTGVVTGVLAGVTTISYTASLGCGISIATANITVHAVPYPGIISGTSVLCVGATGLESSTVPGGVWSASSGHATISSTGVITGVTSGTDTIYYTVTNSCGTAFASRIVSVYATPTAGTITGSASSVCTGGTITLGVSASGGVWSSGNTAVATIGSTGVVTGITAGTATISYSVATGCGSAVAIRMVTVNGVTSASITGITTLCVGSTSTLGSTVTGGLWSSSTPAVAMIGSSSGVVTAIAAGIAVISYTVTGSCGSAIATAIFNVNALPVVPTITGSSTLCIGSNTTFTNTTLGGIWNSSTASVASVSSTGVVTGISSGTATISYTITGGCGAATTTKMVTVYPLPYTDSILGPSSVCAGAVIFLTLSATGGVWSATNSRATVSSTGMVTGISGGVDTIYYSVTTGCGTAMSRKIVTVNAVTAGVISGLTSVCSGATIPLTVSATGGTWSSSSTAIATISGTGIVTGIAAGSTMISYTVTGGCSSAIATFPITVMASPTVGAITGPVNVCVGSTATFTDGTSGGVWLSSTPSIASIGSTGIATGISAGTTTISYLITTGCGSALATTTLNVETMPSAGVISGSTTLCVGTTTVLSCSVSGGTWNSSNITIGLVSPSGVVTGIATGIVSISYSVANSCGSVVSTHIDTVLPAPDPGIITGATGICEGTTTLLSNAVSGGTWSSSNPLVAAISSAGVVTGISAGSVAISYTVSNSCGSRNTLATMTIYSLPYISGILGTTTVYVGSTTTLTNPVSGGSWTSSDITVATIDPAGNVAGISAGTATITYTLINSFGCISDTTILITVSLPTEINNLTAEMKYSFYPNPASNELTIAWKNQYDHEATVVLTDVVGREILSKVIDFPSATGDTRLSLKGIKNGLYLVSIRAISGDYAAKLIIAE